MPPNIQPQTTRAPLHPSTYRFNPFSLKGSRLTFFPPSSRHPLAHLYNQEGHFSSQRLDQNPGLSDGFLASLAELVSTHLGIGDGVGNALGAYGLAVGGGTFDWPTGVSTQTLRLGTTALDEFIFSHVPRYSDCGADDGPQLVGPPDQIPSTVFHHCLRTILNVLTPTSFSKTFRPVPSLVLDAHSRYPHLSPTWDSSTRSSRRSHPAPPVT